MKNIQTLIESRGDLPALPEALIRVQKLITNPDVRIGELADVMRTDPAMAGKVVQVSNSALFGGRTRISDLKQAIVRIGLREARNIVASFSMLKLFDSVRIIDQRAFWKHCLATGYVAQALCRVTRAGKTAENLAYIAGLMHDIGIMVFAYLAPQSYELLMAKVARDIEDHEHLALSHLEDESYRIDHAEAGARYIQYWWPLDDAVIEAVMHHHADYERLENLAFLTQVVAVANRFCHSRGIHNGIQTCRVEMQDEDYELLHLEADVREQFEDRVSIHLDMAEMMISEPSDLATA